MRRFVGLSTGWILAVWGAAAPAVAECPPIAGVEGVVRPGLVLILGEMHGTNESPAFVRDVACHGVAAGLEVVVGLELPTADRQRIDAFLASDGSEAARQAVLAGPFWQGDYQDGRTSWAMLELLDGLRRLRADGGRVRAVPFDVGGAGGGQARDRGMGRALAVVARTAPQAMTIALTGNMHSRYTKGRARDVDYEPMAWVVDQSIGDRELVTLNVGHGGGSAWVCAPDCGVVQLGGHHGERRWSIELGADDRPAGHHGRYYVGDLSASPPARNGEPVLTSRAPQDDAPEDPLAESSVATIPPRPTGELSKAERLFQGEWQSYDYASDSRNWKIRFDARDFRAEGGPDDWYEGFVTIRGDVEPARIDFTILDCRCSYKGSTSSGIYYEDEDSLVISAPTPGRPRPTRFNPQLGDMLRLRPLETAKR